MARWISDELRKAVADRARFLCAYRPHRRSRHFLWLRSRSHHLKHDGPSELPNLAYACVFCNRAKGSDVGSISFSGDFTRFFNPRVDRWLDHFRLESAAIQPLTPIGEVTVRIFRFNDGARLHEREEMIRFGKYPSEEASTIIVP